MTWYWSLINLKPKATLLLIMFRMIILHSGRKSKHLDSLIWRAQNDLLFIPISWKQCCGRSLSAISASPWTPALGAKDLVKSLPWLMLLHLYSLRSLWVCHLKRIALPILLYHLLSYLWPWPGHQPLEKEIKFYSSLYPKKTKLYFTYEVGHIIQIPYIYIYFM